MKAVSRGICAIGAVSMFIMALKVVPAVWQIGPFETVVVVGCLARMALDLIEYAATGRSTT